MRSKVQHKIIFTGPVGSGKTTAIRSISDSEPITTDESASDMTQSMKPSTTVAMDYGTLNMGHGKVHLYGTPGQERFDFMWDILTRGGIGLVLLLDNTRRDPFQDMRFYTSAFRDFIASNKMVVGITRMDMRREPNLQEYRSCLDSLSLRAPIFEVDARQRRDVTILIESLLYSLDPGMDA